MNRRPMNRMSRRAFFRRASLLGAGGLAWVACGGEEQQPDATTLDRTIAIDPEGNLVSAEGEPYAVRTELAEAQTGRENRRRSLVVFHHLSDFRILDEESPARSEWQEDCVPPAAIDAFRPQETLSVQAADALIARANEVNRSPVTSRPAEFAIHTGNATDNAQFNEMRWFIDMMDGKPVYPDSGAIGYQGVQAESPAPAYDNLIEQAQRPFTPVGLDYPWYALVGSRDLLLQGGIPSGDRALRLATGAQKVTKLGPLALQEICQQPQTLLGPGSSASVFNDPETVIRGVGSDPNRRILSLNDWMTEHFATADFPGPLGHGFSPDGVNAGQAYYVIDRGAVVVIVLNTVNPTGFAGGSIDEPQFLWLEQEMIARSGVYYDAAGQRVETQNPDRLIVVASHHPADALNNPFPGPDPSERRYQGPDLEALLQRFPNVVAHIAGHNLEQRINPRPFSGDPVRAYWEITTGSAMDYPGQGRLLEIVDNRDGTLSIFSTVYDSLAPLNPGDAKDPTPEDNINQLRWGAVARQLSVRDPQFRADAAGLAPSDRNAELLLQIGFETNSLPTPSPPPDDLP